MMKYPEGEFVKVGDLIWWNEGVCVGYVIRVLKDASSYEDFGLDEPGIVVSNLHPFEANLQQERNEMCSPLRGGASVYPYSSFREEGVGLLSLNEKSELNWAIGEAQKLFIKKFLNFRYCVKTEMDTLESRESWIIDLLNDSNDVIQTSRLLFRENTRS